MNALYAVLLSAQAVVVPVADGPPSEIVTLFLTFNEPIFFDAKGNRTNLLIPGETSSMEGCEKLALMWRQETAPGQIKSHFCRKGTGN